MIPIWVIAGIIIIVGAVVILGLSEPYELIALAIIGAFIVQTVYK